MLVSIFGGAERKLKGRHLEYKRARGSRQAASRQFEAKTPEVRLAAKPSLAADNLRERANIVVARVSTLTLLGIIIVLTSIYPCVNII